MRDIFQIPRGWIMKPKALNGPRKAKVEPSTALGWFMLKSSEGSGNIENMVGLGRRIRYASSAIGSWYVDLVGNGTAPIRSGVDTREPVANSEDAAHISRVAVSVPTAGVYDHE